MSDVTTLFSETYSEARARFIEACGSRGIPIRHYEHPLKGPGDEPLFCDVAEMGPADSSTACLQIAGTHGVEGILGSALLIDLIRKAPQPNMRMLLVHGLNPWGFANLCRFTENHVDLNRNFLDFDGAVPDNDGYRELHTAICPAEWTEATCAEFRAALAAYDARHGTGKGLDATLRGQYSHPDGFNYGGASPEWSHQCLKGICEQLGASTEEVLVVDWHTGLGKWSENVLIPYAPGGVIDIATLARFGLDQIKPARGYPAYTGPVTEGVRRFVPQARVVGLVAEFGIDDDPWVNVDGLRYDQWLCFGGAASTDVAQARSSLRDLYCPPDADWRKSAIEDAARLNRLVLEAVR